MRQIFCGIEFQKSGAWYWKDLAPAPFRLTPRTVRGFWEEGGRDLEVSMRTDSRRGKIVECRQSTAMKELSVQRKCVLLQGASEVSTGELWHSHGVFWQKITRVAWVYFLQSGYMLGGNGSQEWIAAVSPREYVWVSQWMYFYTHRYATTIHTIDSLHIVRKGKERSPCPLRNPIHVRTLSCRFLFCF